MVFPRHFAIALMVLIPTVSAAGSFTVVSADRTVYTELHDRLGSFDPPPETVVVSDSFGGLGPFDSTVINHRTSIDQQFFTTATASQLSIVDENSVTAFLDADFVHNGPQGPWFGGYAESSLDVTLLLEQDMNFELFGEFSSGPTSGAGNGVLSLTNLGGEQFDFSGTWESANCVLTSTCPVGGSTPDFSIGDWDTGTWGIQGLMPAGTYQLSASFMETWQDNESGSMDISFSVSAIPEPSTTLLIGLGLIGLVAAKRR
jgi:hypothetical protein